MDKSVRSNLWHLGIATMTAYLCACGASSPLADSSAIEQPVPPPPALQSLSPHPGYRVQDQRNYFHQHYGTLTTYVRSSGKWFDFSRPEHWANVSGYVYGSLNISIQSWWWIPEAGSFTGYIYRWEPNKKRWQLYRSLGGEFPVYVRDL